MYFSHILGYKWYFSDWNYSASVNVSISIQTEVIFSVRGAVLFFSTCPPRTNSPYTSRFVFFHNFFLSWATLWRCCAAPRPNTEAQGATLALLRRVLLRQSQGMTLNGQSILGLPPITHKVPLRNSKSPALFVLMLSVPR